MDQLPLPSRAHGLCGLGRSTKRGINNCGVSNGIRNASCKIKRGMCEEESKPGAINLTGALDESAQAFQKSLDGLGKCTRRGIKRCHNCGVYNGTRSAACKNKECGVILKDSVEKLKLDAVRLLTGTEKRIYSVRVRDMGPDCRGFVQLPVKRAEDVALCFVHSCQNSFDNSILKCHEMEENRHQDLGTALFCAHIEAALLSRTVADSINSEDDILAMLRFSDEVKESLYKGGHLVQRVSKSVMAVKCQVNPKHPLGYLHFTFLKGRGKESYERFRCSCNEYNAFGVTKVKPNKCIHYYACIWALASDKKCKDEFVNLIKKERIQEGDVILINPEQNFSTNEVLVSKLQVKRTVKDWKMCRKSKQPKQSTKNIAPKIQPIEIKILTEAVHSEESSLWLFTDWLSFATESINKTMRFENSGNINTLLFHIPEGFYKCLLSRIRDAYEPVCDTGISISYHIMNILHVKKIFNSPQVKLKISKKFFHNEQQGYVECDENMERTEFTSSFIFFLNVGQFTVDESDNTNNFFLIEWTPSITTITNVGQLKLCYKYGCKRL